MVRPHLEQNIFTERRESERLSRCYGEKILQNIVTQGKNLFLQTANDKKFILGGNWKILLFAHYPKSQVLELEQAELWSQHIPHSSMQNHLSQANQHWKYAID